MQGKNAEKTRGKGRELFIVHRRKDYSEDARATDFISEDTLNGVNPNGVWRPWCSQIGREKERGGVSMSGTRDQWRKGTGGLYRRDKGIPWQSRGQGASLVAQLIKNPPANAGDAGSIPGSGRRPGEENENPFQCSCLGNPMDRGAWRATVHRVKKKLDMT